MYSVVTGENPGSSGSLSIFTMHLTLDLVSPHSLFFKKSISAPLIINMSDFKICAIT